MCIIKGIGKSKAITIQAVLEIRERISSEVPKKFSVTCPTDLKNLYMESLRYLTQEVFKVVLLDNKNQIIDAEDIYKGTANSISIQSRDVFGYAIKHGACKIIVIHNHPSGDSKPSKEDISITKKLAKAGELLGIHLLDHLIFGDGEMTSLKEKGIF